MNENSILKPFIYEGNQITFETGNEVMVNATQMAKQFGKLPNDWLRLPGTQEFINELSIARKSRNCDYQAVITRAGAPETGGGTWLHEDAAIEFARWLSPKFAIWCNDRIKELITQGHAEMNPYVTPENMLKVSKALLCLNEQFETAMNRLNEAMQVMDKQTSLILKQGSVISEQKEEISDKQQMIDAAVVEIQERDVQISKMQPYADYAEQTLMSKSEYTFTEVAKDLGFRSVYQFQDWAKEKGIIFRQGERWLATANWSGRGWFGVRTFNKLGENNKVLTRVSTTITERGRAAMHYFLTHSRRPSETELNKMNNQ